MTSNGYTDIVWAARDQVKQAKAQIQLNLARDTNGNIKGFYKHVSDKWNTGENAGPLLNETQNLLTLDN